MPLTPGMQSGDVLYRGFQFLIETYKLKLPGTDSGSSETLHSFDLLMHYSVDETYDAFLEMYKKLGF